MGKQEKHGLFPRTGLPVFLITVLLLTGCETLDTAKQNVSNTAARLVQDSQTAEASMSDEERVAGYRLAAAKGDADARYRLGELYKEGKTVPTNDAEALKLFRLAADQGHAGAQVALGEMYESGRGVAQDYGEAVKLFRLAADQDHAEGQAHMGVMYFQGRGVKQNDAEALKWFRRATDRGSARGKNGMGLLYESGRGVAKNEAEAVKWYRKAADQGYAAGQTNLGVMYLNGKGIPRNDAEARKWFGRAADQGDARGQRLLGFMWLNGRGGGKDETQAIKWFRRAARGGDTWSREQVEKIGNYDALDDDWTIVTYEEHLKAHSLELYKQNWFTAFSGNGTCMVVPFAKKGEPENFVGMSVWKYDPRRETFVKHPFRFWRKLEAPLAVTLSHDGTLMAFKGEGGITVVDLERNQTVRKISQVDSLSRFAISRDNELLAAGHFTIDTYSLRTGAKLDSLKLADALTSSSVEELAFLNQRNLVVESHSFKGDRVQTIEVLNEKLRRIRIIGQVKSGNIFGVLDISPDGSRLAVQHYPFEWDKPLPGRNIKIFNVESGTWEKATVLYSGQFSFGPPERFATARRYALIEYLLHGDTPVPLREMAPFRKGIVFYVPSAGSWCVLQEDRLQLVRPAPDALVRAMVTLEEGRKMLTLGFLEPGAAKVKEAMAAFPAADRLNDTGFYVDLAKEKVPLRHIGGLLLAQYGELLKDQTGLTGQALANAVERLRDYGMFASAAGHPDLALQAAQRIRFLQNRFPGTAPWDRLLKNAVALEALYIAASQSPGKAYDHILSQGGLAHDDYTEAADSITHSDTWSYWFLLYSDRNKLAYLLKRDASRLPTTGAATYPRQPYPDLTGRLMEPRA
jgi:TPR repeat protein